MAGRWFLLSLMLLTLLAGCKEDNVKKITIYKNGASQQVSDQKAIHVIGKQIASYSTNIDDVIRIILTPSQIDEMINHENGIEVVYANNQKAYRINNDHAIVFSQMYIPLSGKFAKFGIVFFFGDKEGYGSLPPYVTTEGLKELKSIVNHIEYK